MRCIISKTIFHVWADDRLIAIGVGNGKDAVLVDFNLPKVTIHHRGADGCEFTGGGEATRCDLDEYPALTMEWKQWIQDHLGDETIVTTLAYCYQKLLTVEEGG